MRKLFIIMSFIIGSLMTSCSKEDKIKDTLNCTPLANDSSSMHPKAIMFQTVLNDFVKRGLPGISVAIRDRNGLWLGSAGKADIAHDIDMQTCHVNKTASITKMLMGTLTFLLAEDGVLSLDDPIRKYLSSSTLKGIKNADKATIRACLGHYTGIADVIIDQDFYLHVLNQPDKFWEKEALLDFIRGDDAVFTYGDSVHYSNTNTLLVAMVIEAATGKPHDQLLRERVIGPNHMDHTYYYWHDILPSDVVAQGYFDLYNNQTIVNVTNYNTGSGNGYTGLYSTALDLLNFVEALFRTKTVLKPASLAQMLTFGKREEDSNRLLGLGCMKDFLERPADQFAYGHRGRDLGYSADAFYFPNQDMTLCLLVNYGTDAKSSLQQVFFDFRSAIIDAMMK